MEQLPKLFNQSYDAFVVDPILAEKFADNWHDTVTKIEKRNFFSTALEHVTPRKWNVSFQPFTLAMEEDKYIHPVLLSEVNSAIMKGRYLKETEIRHVMHLNTTVMVLYSIFGDIFINSIFIQMLKHYFDTIGYDTFIESGTGEITSNTYDSMAPTRVLMMLNAFWWQQMKFIDDAIILEALETFLQDPLTNMSKQKSASKGFKHAAFISSTSGLKCQWQGDTKMVKNFLLLEATARDFDNAMLAIYKPDIDEAKKKMVDLHGDGIIVKTYEYLLMAPVNDDTAKLWMAMSFLEGLGGYFRGNEKLSVLDQIKKFPPKVTHPWIADQVENEYKLMMEWVIKNRSKILKFSNFKESFFKAATTKSSGMPPVELTFTYEVDGIRKRKTIRASDKTTLMMVDPEMAIAKDILMTLGTFENPMSVGFRIVPGRDVRGIFVMPLAYYLLEWTLGVGMYAYMRANGRTSLGTKWTVANMTGNAVVDHAQSLFTSGWYDKYADMTDFSQFDASQDAVSVRLPALRGIMAAMASTSTFASLTEDEKELAFKRDPEVMKKYNLTETWGEFIDYAEVVWVLWKKIAINTYFNVKGEVVLVDAEKSGEFVTLGNNTLVNEAFHQKWLIIKLLYVKAGVLTEEASSVLGDDALTTLQAEGDAEDMKNYRRGKAVLAKNSSLGLTESDVVIRKPWCEYLKVFTLLGRLIPRFPVLQIFATEKGSGSGKLLEDVRAYLDFLIIAISRGFDRILCTKLGYGTWLMRRLIREKDTDTKRLMPLYLYAAPVSRGGFGRWHPYSGVNTAVGTIMQALKHDRVNGNHAFADAINLAIDLHAFSKISSRSEIAKALNKSGAFVKGQKFIKENIPSQLFARAKVANTELKASGIDIGPFTLMNSSNTRVEAMIKDSPNLKNVDFQDKALYIARALRHKPSGKDWLEEEMAWMSYITFEFGDTVEPSDPISFVGAVGRDLQNLVRTMGHSKGKLINTDPKQIFFELFDNPSFPNHIRPEQLMAIMTRPDILGDHEKMRNVLIAMGAERDVANVIISKLDDLDSSMSFYAETGNYSLMDQIAQYLDMSRASMDRLVEIPPVADQKTIGRLMLDIGILIFLMQDWNKLRTVKIIMLDAKMAYLNKILVGRLSGQLVRLLGVYRMEE
jgi:hypothetical protein